jgi:hypothetical protein
MDSFPAVVDILILYIKFSKLEVKFWLNTLNINDPTKLNTPGNPPKDLINCSIFSKTSANPLFSPIKNLSSIRD